MSVDEPARQIIARSLPLLDQHRDLLIERVEASFRASTDEAAQRPGVAAMMLVDLLLAQARNVAQMGRLSDLSDLAARHRAFSISGRIYSRFGDILIPILKDSLGPTLPAEISSAWGDLFWTIIREIQSQDEPIEA